MARKIDIDKEIFLKEALMWKAGFIILRSPQTGSGKSKAPRSIILSALNNGKTDSPS